MCLNHLYNYVYTIKYVQTKPVICPLPFHPPPSHIHNIKLNTASIFAVWLKISIFRCCSSMLSFRFDCMVNLDWLFCLHVWGIWSILPCSIIILLICSCINFFRKSLTGIWSIFVLKEWAEDAGIWINYWIMRVLELPFWIVH